MKLFTAIARELDRVARCTASNHPALDNAESCLAALLARLPSGSGFDSGVKLDREQSTVDRLVFNADFHHMSESGFYDGWTTHQVIIKPSLLWGFDMRITGRNRNEIKDYIYEVMESVLNEDVDGKGA